MQFWDDGALAALTPHTSAGIPSFPGALPEARQSRAILSSSMLGSLSSSSSTSRRSMVFRASAVTIFIHPLDISRVCCKLDLVAELKPIVVGASSGAHLDLVASSPEGLQVTFAGAGFISSMGLSLLLNNRHHFFRVSLEPVCWLAGLLAKDGNGGTVHSVSKVLPSFAGTGIGISGKWFLKRILKILY